MLSVAYVSAAAHEMSDAELVELLAEARAENTARGITGMLLYSGGNFMQVIEGPDEVVRSAYARIAGDPRHRGIITILEEPVEQRRFAEWSMGFRRLTARELQDVAGWSDIMQGARGVTAGGATGEAVYDMLLTFRDTMS